MRIGRNAKLATVLLLAAAAAVGAVMKRRADAAGGTSVTARTDYGRHHPAAKTETATFAAGCFWKLEHAMRRVEGVVSTTAGYTGGESRDPTHAAVSAGRTGHTEAVRVEFDPSAVSYEKLLDVFWKSHDPTQFTPEEGDPAAGRSAVFFHADAQRAAAEESKRRLQASGKYAAELPTEILPATAFFPAEAEHQQYIEKRGRGASCGVS